MKQELELIRAAREPMHAVPFGQNRADLTPLRRLIRESSDDLIEGGLMSDGIPALSWRVIRFLIDVVKTIDQVNLEPQVEEFVGAAISLIRFGRDGVDRGLQIHDAATINTAAVMIEITVHGLCSVLGLHYDELLPIVHRGDHEEFQLYMQTKGYLREPENSERAANDPGAPD